MHIMYYTLIMYLIFFALTYSYFNVKDKKLSKRNIEAYIVSAIALIFRLLISTSLEGHTTDILCFKGWAQNIAQLGLRGFYSGSEFADYPPGYMLVLYVIGLVQRLFNIDSSSNIFTILIKLPSIIADILLGLIIYKTSVQIQSKKPAITLMMLVVFSPAVIINSTVWGQIDSFFTLFMVLSLICVYNEEYYKGALLYTICALIKPQAFIIAPVYLCAYLSTGNWKMIGKSILISLAAVFAVALPFTSNLNFTWLIEKYRSTLTSYPYASVNAYNLYAALGYNWSELSTKIIMLPISVWSYITILAVTAGSIWFYFKSENKAKIFYMAYLIVAVMFTVGAKMHERYLFPALLLLALTYIYNKDKRILMLFICQSAAHYLNVGDVLISNIRGGEISPIVVVGVSILHIIALWYSLYLAYNIFIPHTKKEKKHIPPQSVVISKPLKADYIIMAAITLVYSIIAFAGLGDTKAPQTFYRGSETIVADLGQTRGIGSVMMYLGIGSGKYTIEISDDGKVWEHYADQEHDSVFIWRRATGDANARYLRFTPNKPDLMLGEIGIMDKNGAKLIIESSTAEELIDEQDIVPIKPSYMNGTYFDEIYHPRTAYEILHKLAPYEVTHPPLGKVIMSLGIMAFGMTPFGWRFMGTVAGILMVPLFYLMCKKLVRRTDFAAIGTIIFTFDFMHYAQTRLGTIDSYAVLLIMLMYYYIIDYFAMDFNKEPLKKGLLPLALCGIAFGIGAATKWICLYSALGLAVIIFTVWIRAFIRRKDYPDFNQKLIKSIAWCILFFIIIPSLIYFASYLPQIRYDLHGRTPLQYVVENQKYMLTYHKGVTDTHPYSSKWYEWIVDKRPLWAYIDNELRDQGIVSSISSFGNPVVWWGGFIAVLGCIYIGFIRKNSNCMVILIAYLSQLVPWIPVPRVLFIYHYFACVPFMALAIACLMEYMCENLGFKLREMYGYCAVVVLLFIMFYPVLSGMSVDKWYVVNILKWFDSWTFTN